MLVQTWSSARDIGADEAKANARVIAASPDLLSACLEAEDFLFSLPGESEERREVIERLRAAISKAGAKVADTSATGEGR
jgi:hypothetical protein